MGAGSQDAGPMIIRRGKERGEGSEIWAPTSGVSGEKAIACSATTRFRLLRTFGTS